MSGPIHLLPGETRVPIIAWVKGVAVEGEAIEQLRNVANLPFVRRVAVMPDTHWGMGATVGSVVGTRGAIVPAAVGVDIGCGMMAVRTNLRAEDLPDSLAGVRAAIERAVPTGRTDDGGPNDRGAWRDPPPHAALLFAELAQELKRVIERAGGGLGDRWGPERALAHFGTLGTGNHFIEVCIDEQGRVWVMLHSGSRGIGNAIGRHFIALAQEDMKRWFIDLPDKDLAYIPEGSEHFEDYLAAVEWAQGYALWNRRTMMDAVLLAFSAELGRPVWRADHEVVECHHNYVARENHGSENLIVTRKGAVRAREGDRGIIPGSMGTRSYIVIGKGNPASLNSCSHGAGRAMSRTEAKRRFTLADHGAALAGIECDKSAGTLDETPSAYKPIDAVMEAQADLVAVLHELRQVCCVKGAEDGSGSHRARRRARREAREQAAQDDSRVASGPLPC
jgi:tRNA-splicing ligase RtcB